MDRDRVSRNDPCPCGSGRKYKKCCSGKEPPLTALERLMAIEVLESFVEGCDDRHEAREEFYGDLDLDVPAMTEEFRAMSDGAFLFWFVFDRQLEDGSYLVDRVLKANPVLSAGEIRYLRQMRSTAMLPYEVIAVQPGVSVTLRRVGAQEEIEVRERTASRMLKRWDLLVTRLNPSGPSGGAEMEMAALLIAPLVQKDVLALAQPELDQARDEADLVRRCKGLTAAFHQIWLESIVAPRLPKSVTAEGDPLVFVTQRFDVLDEPRLRKALNAESSLQGELDTWHWMAGDSLLGMVELAGPELTLETQSEPRADRGRLLLERIAQDALAYRSCERVDLNEAVLEAIRSGKRPEPPPDAADEIPPEIQDQLFQEFMAKHSQGWLDEQIPALDQQTPRAAAQSPALRPRLVALLKDNENRYLRALAGGQPAFDPTWMWDELGLSEHQDAPRLRHRVQLAHESLEEHLPGLAQVIESAVERRCAASDGLLETAVTPAELRADAQVQQFVTASRNRCGPDQLLAHLEFYCNYELQRRKTFWVDESLAWMLAHTQVDAESNLFRLPFSSYVLVYTDRHTLSVAERALAQDAACPLRGQMLAVLCVYVVELAPGGTRLKLGLTFDAFAGQPPHLLSWEVQVQPTQTLDQAIEEALVRARTPAAGFFRPLLEAALNATLYTTSASVQIEKYRTDRPPPPAEPQTALPSDAVYYLPGKIKISHMRKLQQVARGPSGRTLMHRFLVRGHWRRPGANWKDQSLRWIEPYWRGPSLASIIEREYRVSP